MRVVQSLNCTPLFVTPWTTAHQAFLSFTISQSLPKLISIELVMPSNHLILFRPLLLLALKSFPAQGSFPRSWLFPSGGQNSGASASATVLPMNIQGWFPLGFIGLISLQSKGLCLICLLSSHTQFSKILSTSSSSPPSHSSTPSIPPPGVETILAYITSDQHFTKCWVDIFQSSSY